VGRSVDVDNLVGAAEIAEKLGVERTVVHNWRRRSAPVGMPDFPDPIAELGRFLVWHWPDVESWARATGRLRRQKGGR
jgi:predicted DNA-binding transcriptional regulator AlpA